MACVQILNTIKNDNEHLSGDYVSRLSLLDDATREVFEVWLDHMESLFATYPIRRLLLPEFLEEWGTWEASEDLAVIRQLAEAAVEVQQSALIAGSIDGHLNMAESDSKGDRRLLAEASSPEMELIFGFRANRPSSP